VLAVLALAGCTAAVKKDEDSAVIKEKSAQRWDFLIAHQADKAYDFLSPGYRATKKREDYASEMNARGIQWSKVAFGSQQCETDVCHVHLTVQFKHNMGGPAGVVSSLGFVTETWVKVDGRWYFLPEQFRPTTLGKGKES
jgi:hypothetical protein